MIDKILFVDDEVNILSGYKRSLRRDLNIDTATSGAEALTLFQTNKPYPVVVSDMRMPNMNGVEFLTAVRENWPDTVRIMLTGQADMKDAIDAVNKGNIFRFLTKPCDPELLSSTLTAALKQHHLIIAERELLEKTLNGSIQVLSDILSLINPYAFSRGDRIQRYVHYMVTSLHLTDIWQYELAARLSQIGLVTIPADIMKKFLAGDALSEEENMMIQNCPSVSHDLLVSIPRLENIAKMIAWQQENFSSLNATTELDKVLTTKEQIKLGAQAIKISMEYDINHNLFHESHSHVIAQMETAPEVYHPQLVSAIKNMETAEGIVVVQEISIFDLDSRMVLEQDVKTTNGLFLAPKDMQVTTTLIKFLRNYVTRNEVEEMVKVKIVN